MSDYDTWKLATPEEMSEPARAEEEDPPGALEDESEDSIPREPPVGSWAAVAREMAKDFPDFDWDAWKDEMKERED